MRKNTFFFEIVNVMKYIYFMFKALFFFRCLNFCPDFLVMYKNCLIRKLRLISKFMTSHTGQQIITIRIFPNTSRNKDNQTMKFGQL